MKYLQPVLTFLKKNKMAPVLIGMAILAIILLSLAMRTKSIQITAITPADQTPNVNQNAPIVITFSQSLPSDQIVYFELTPPIAGTVTYAQDRTKATFLPQGNYQLQTPYKISIKSPSLKSFTSSFSTRSNTGFGAIVPAQDVNSESSPRMNFIKKLPYTDPSFTIRYLETSNTIDINITALPYEDSKQKALDYLKNEGLENPFTQFNVSIDLDRTLNPLPQ